MPLSREKNGNTVRPLFTSNGGRGHAGGASSYVRQHRNFVIFGSCGLLDIVYFRHISLLLLA